MSIMWWVTPFKTHTHTYTHTRFCRSVEGMLLAKNRGIIWYDMPMNRSTKGGQKKGCAWALAFFLSYYMHASSPLALRPNLCGPTHTHTHTIFTTVLFLILLYIPPSLAAASCKCECSIVSYDDDDDDEVQDGPRLRLLLRPTMLTRYRHDTSSNHSWSSSCSPAPSSRSGSNGKQ